LFQSKKFSSSLKLKDSDIHLHDFDIVKLLGRGSFGKVVLARKKDNNKYYAMKILKKEFIEKNNQTFHAQTEREILERINHPFIIKLKYAFQNAEKLFFVTDYMHGGELFYHLRKEQFFNEIKAKFYICEIILAIEYLHKNKIIYRDLKPENILLTKDGHIKLTDFGLSKIFYKNESERAYTICGTPEYLAPEIIAGNSYDKSVDWWSLGALLYEMLVGYSPYKEIKRQNKLDIKFYLKKIEQHKNISNSAFSLIKGLLNPDPLKRLGSSYRDARELKEHFFFDRVNWVKLYELKEIPPFIPVLKDEDDLSNFDKIFTNEDPNSFKVTCYTSNISKQSKENEKVPYNFKYEDFTYVCKELVMGLKKTTDASDQCKMEKTN